MKFGEALDLLQKGNHMIDLNSNAIEVYHIIDGILCKEVKKIGESKWKRMVVKSIDILSVLSKGWAVTFEYNNNSVRK